MGLAGFGPGTPVGAQGSLGPRGEPGKTAFFTVHLEYFTLIARKPRQTLAHGNPSPSSLVGYPVSGWRGGLPLWLGSECAPRRAEGAPRSRVESRAKRLFLLSTLRIFHTRTPEAASDASPWQPLPLLPRGLPSVWAERAVPALAGFGMRALAGWGGSLGPRGEPGKTPHCVIQQFTL